MLLLGHTPRARPAIRRDPFPSPQKFLERWWYHRVPLAESARPGGGVAMTEPTEKPPGTAWSGLAEKALFVLVAVLVPFCLHAIFRSVPTEEKMGGVQRIFYFHVPSAFPG